MKKGIDVRDLIPSPDGKKIFVNFRDLNLRPDGENSFRVEHNGVTIFQRERRRKIYDCRLLRPRKNKTTFLLGNVSNLIRWNQVRVVIRAIPGGGRSVKIYDGWKRVGTFRIETASA